MKLEKEEMEKKERPKKNNEEEEETITPNEISLNPYRKTTKWGNFDAPF